MKLILVFLVSFLGAKYPIVEGYTSTVHLYEHGHCSALAATRSVSNGCTAFGSVARKISGAKLVGGSCVKLRRGDGRSSSCSGSTYTLMYPNENLCVVPKGWNDYVGAMASCAVRSVEISCPLGTYVREIAYGSANSGITIFCYDPTRDAVHSIRTTHGSGASQFKTACPIAARGIMYAYDGKWGIYVAPKAKCDNKVSYGSMVCTQKHGALVGLKVVIDEANVVKSIGIICRDVPDPSKICEPKESLTALIVCDNSGSDNNLSCGYSTTIGVGVAQALSEKEGKEHQFSTEVGFSATAGGNFLSATVSGKIGKSELVAFEWTKTDTTTWKNEETYSAEIQVRPRTISMLQQLTAKCSFYGVRTKYFKQTDIDQKGKVSVKVAAFK